MLTPTTHRTYVLGLATSTPTTIARRRRVFVKISAAEPKKVGANITGKV